MNNTMIKQVVLFAVGAVAGSLATYVAMKTKCEKQIQEEVNSVRKAFATYDESTRDNNSEASTEPESKDEENSSNTKTYERYNSLLHNYTPTEEPAKNTSTTGKVRDYIPEVIPPEDYGEIEEYDQLEYTYFADCVIVDSDGDIVDADEVEDTISFESLNHFGDYESDAVYIKNDERHAYYAVYKDLRKYSEVRTLNGKPRRTEV